MSELPSIQNQDVSGPRNEQKELIPQEKETTKNTSEQALTKQEFYNDDEMKAIMISGIKSMVGGLLLHIELGTFYVWGSISPYICSWMREKDLSVTLNYMAIIFPILGLITMSCLSFGIKIAEKIGFKVTIGLCSTSIALAFLIISFVQDIGGFIAIYCIMVGISGGLAYMLPIICGWRHFPDKRGLVSGITIGGYGFGSFIFNFVCKAIANPDNEKPSVIFQEDGKNVKYFDNNVGNRVPLMLQVLAACYLGLAILATLLIRFPKEIDVEKLIATIEAKKKKNAAENPNQQVHVPSSYLPLEKECQTVSKGVKNVVFPILVLIVLMSCTLGMLISNCYKFYGQELGIDDATLTATGSVAGVMNGCSRFFWATLSDKTSFKFTFTLISILNLITSAILPYNTDGIGYLLLIAIVYLAEGGLLATYPLICATVYGKKIGGLMYGFLFFMIGVCNMLGYIFYRFARLKIGWEGVYWICFGMNVAGIILGIILKEKGYDWRDVQVQASDQLKNDNSEHQQLQQQQ